MTTLRHGQGDVDEGGDGQRAAREGLLKRLAFEQFHRDERWIGPDVVDGTDVGMIERGGRARFPLKAFQSVSYLIGKPGTWSSMLTFLYEIIEQGLFLAGQINFTSNPHFASLIG